MAGKRPSLDHGWACAWTQRIGSLSEQIVRGHVAVLTLHSPHPLKTRPKDWVQVHYRRVHLYRKLIEANSMSDEVLPLSYWRAVTKTHYHESQDPRAWLLYGVGLLQTIQPGPDAAKQQQQAALAFRQAEMHGASAQEVAAHQWQAVEVNLRDALAACGIEHYPVRPPKVTT